MPECIGFNVKLNQIGRGVELHRQWNVEIERKFVLFVTLYLEVASLYPMT